jgi:hypothetical protein
MQDRQQARHLHEDLDFIGLRAQATAVGLLQLSAELVKAGVLGKDAIQRVKDAILQDLCVSNPRAHQRGEFEHTLRKRLDAIFPKCEAPQETPAVGGIDTMKSALRPDVGTPDGA